MRPKISIIAAIGKNRELGKNNRLLWHIPEDLKRFKKLTQGHAVIMGRKTFESIGKPLPNRTNIVISKNRAYSPTGCYVANSIKEAVEIGKKYSPDEIFIIGGGQIYNQALPYAQKLYLTIVDAEAEADTFFPDYSEFKKIVSQEKKQADGYHCTFLELTKL